MDTPAPDCFWTVIAEPWAEALVALAPGLGGFLYRTAGRVFPDGCPLTPEQVRGHPQAVPFRVYNRNGHVTKEGAVVGKDTALAEFLEELCRGWPSDIEFFENGGWHRVRYGTWDED